MKNDTCEFVKVICMLIIALSFATSAWSMWKRLSVIDTYQYEVRLQEIDQYGELIRGDF
ncbi:hypothetical protein [Psychrobacillus glaciei]|uniref:hypothetical protein n=1 Tax=Psychrobacillus glaciei TaxID=2283160 RepID=UPI00178C4BA5|nr:hypothetical protein [Psychrobacillus glaciei]